MTQRHPFFSWLKTICLVMYGLVGALFIDILSTNPYEWMIGEDDGGVPTTLCTILPPIDDTSDVAWLVSFFMGVPLLAFALHHLWRRRWRRAAVLLAMAAGLLAFCCYRTWGRFLACRHGA